MGKYKTVYMISSGCYSDYNVEAVFEDEHEAQTYVQMLNDSELSRYESFFVEERPVVTSGMKVELVPVFNVAATGRGMGFRVELRSTRLVPDYLDLPRRPQVHEGFNRSVWAECTDLEAAKKAVNDRVTQMIAQGDAE